MKNHFIKCIFRTVSALPQKFPHLLDALQILVNVVCRNVEVFETKFLLNVFYNATFLLIKIKSIQFDCMYMYFSHRVTFGTVALIEFYYCLNDTRCLVLSFFVSVFFFFPSPTYFF
jgi:hypothetical protein